MREGAPLRSARVAGVHRDAAPLELLARPSAEVVLGERREEEARAGEVGELDGRHRAAACGLLPRLERVHDLAWPRRVLDAGELHPLHVSDDREVHSLFLRRGLVGEPWVPPRWNSTHSTWPTTAILMTSHLERGVRWRGRWRAVPLSLRSSGSTRPTKARCSRSCAGGPDAIEPTTSSRRRS